jgi:hypothetical protein
MNSKTRFFFALAALSTGLVTASLAADPAPGYVDFGSLTASEKGQYVEVKLNGFMLNFVAKLAKHEDPAAADLIANLKSVRVNVVGLDDANRSATTDRVLAVRKQLEGKGWEQIVTVHGKREEDVAIYVKHRDEAIEGLVVTVIDARKNEAVLVNVVGDIKPEQLAVLGKHLHIDHLDLDAKTI